MTSTVMGVSKTVWAAFTFETMSVSASGEISWGRMVIPPRRATVSAMRLPATAVMLETTSGIEVPTESGVVRSTSERDTTADLEGTMKVSL